MMECVSENVTPYAQAEIESKDADGNIIREGFDGKAVIVEEKSGSEMGRAVRMSAEAPHDAPRDDSGGKPPQQGKAASRRSRHASTARLLTSRVKGQES